MLTAGVVKEWAVRQGLTAAIAPAVDFQLGEEALQWRQERGIKTPFAGGSLEERCRPRCLYPGARSLVVVALPHPRQDMPPGPGEPLVARYALGRDYHDVLHGHLRDLAALLEQAGATLAAIQVDGGPLLEREAAYLAGLGYYGASCNLIIPGMGTGASLGLLITDLELEPGVPRQSPDCRGCGRCLAACPTGALVAPGRLDPEHCLSYLTQKRGMIPAELRPFFDRYIWGCDACQEACPVNRQEREKLPQKDASTAGERPAVLSPYAILNMDRAQFRDAFKHTPMAWRGKTVLQRNVVLFLGNRGDGKDLPLLEQALRAPAPVLRGHAAWALGRLGAAARPVLDRARRVETDPGVRREIETALDGCS